MGRDAFRFYEGIKMARRPSKHSLQHSRLTKYWKLHQIKRAKPARNVKRVPGKTKKYVKGTGTKVWVGKDVTRDGWMSRKKWNELKKEVKK